MTMPYLPFDLIEEILYRVQIKSINRFRSVCKQWNTLFREQRFIHKHRQLSPSPKQFVLWKRDMACLTDISFDGNSEDVNPSSNLHTFHLSGLSKIYDMIHLEGLLLCTTNNGLVLWNPCLGRVRWIERSYVSCVVLGFERNNGSGNGYKILRVCDPSPDMEEQAEIYELPQRRRRKLDLPLDWYIEVPKSRASLKRVSYWIASWMTGEVFIQSFDFSTERFRQIVSPPLENGALSHLAISDFRGDRLSLLERCYMTKRIEVWATNEIGSGAVSWTKLMTLAMPKLWRSDSLNPPGFFFYDDNKLVLCCCDKGIGTVRLCIDGEVETRQVLTTGRRFNRLTYPCNYVPSLVWFPAAGKRRGGVV